MAATLDSRKVRVFAELPFRLTDRRLVLAWHHRNAATRPAVADAVKALGELLQVG